MANWFQNNLILENELIRLLPLYLDHKVDLTAAASDGKLWELWYTAVPSPDSMEGYLTKAMEARANGSAFAFAVQDKASGKLIGSTRYLNIDLTNRRLEIGNTWYAKSYQRTRVNTACKLLLLQHAFEALDCIAVEFRTHWHNHRSRAAISRLGAKQDGVLRNHRITADGILRDTVVFSILNSEWPTVKKSLAFQLERGRD